MSDESAAATDWGVAALQADLAPLLPGLRIEIVASVPSTNSMLLERARDSGRDARAEAAVAVAQTQVQVRRSVESRAFGPRPGPKPPCLLVAERQTAGRGRQGKHWASAAGASLTFSLLASLAARDWSGLSLAVGVALAEALDPIGALDAPRIGLKWPNDLWLVDPSREDGNAPVGRKLGGILIEAIASTDPRRAAVIGVGLNLAPFDAGAISSGLAALHELDPALDGPSALRRVALPLVRALRRFETDGFAPFAAAYARRDVLRDRPVTTTSAAVPDGIARGVDPDGALRVDTAGGSVRIASGEVSVRPRDVSNTAGAAAC